MKITKVINNNAAYSVDEQGREIIVVGKGVGFQKKAGEALDGRRVEKVFRFMPEQNSQYEQLVAALPYEHIRLAGDIIHHAKQVLGKPLNTNIYITLTDHMNFAIERQKKGIAFQNALLWEIKRFYQAEYEIGLWAIDRVKEQTGIQLPEDEAGFFTLHIVNAEMAGASGQAAEFPTILKGALNIVRRYLRLEINESSISYERFITHLKFLMQRMVEGNCYDEADAISREMWDDVRTNYPKCYQCAKLVHSYIRQYISAPESEEELIYLTVHIARIARTAQKANA